MTATVLVLAFTVFLAVMTFHPLLAELRFPEVPRALFLCLCGRRYRRHLAGILARRREAARCTAPRPLPVPPDVARFADLVRSARAGSAPGQRLRAEDALLAELAGVVRLNSAAMADVAGAFALLARGFVTIDEARDRVAAMPWPSGGIRTFEDIAGSLSAADVLRRAQ